MIRLNKPKMMPEKLAVLNEDYGLYPTIVRWNPGNPDWHKIPKVKLSEFTNGLIQDMNPREYGSALIKAIHKKIKDRLAEGKKTEYYNRSDKIALYCVSHTVIDIDSIKVFGEPLGPEESLLEYKKELLLETELAPFIKAGLCFPSASGRGFHILTSIPAGTFGKTMKQEVEFSRKLTVQLDILTYTDNNPRYHILSKEALEFFLNYDKALVVNTTEKAYELIAVLKKSIKNKEIEALITGTNNNSQLIKERNGIQVEKTLEIYAKALLFKNAKAKISIATRLKALSFIHELVPERTKYKEVAFNFFKQLPNFDATITTQQLSMQSPKQKGYNFILHFEEIVNDINTYCVDEFLGVFERDYKQELNKTLKFIIDAEYGHALLAVKALFNSATYDSNTLREENIKRLNNELAELNIVVEELLKEFKFSKEFIDLYEYIKKYGQREERMKSPATAFFAATTILGVFQQAFLFETGSYQINTNMYSLFIAPSGSGKSTLSKAIQTILQRLEDSYYCKMQSKIASAPAFLSSLAFPHTRSCVYMCDEAFQDEPVKAMLFNEKAQTHQEDIKTYYLNLFNDSKLPTYESLTQKAIPGVDEVHLSMCLFGQVKAFATDIDLVKGGFSRFLIIPALQYLTINDFNDESLESAEVESTYATTSKILDSIGLHSEVDNSRLATKAQRVEDCDKVVQQLFEKLYKDFKNENGLYQNPNADEYLLVRTMNEQEFDEYANIYTSEDDEDKKKKKSKKPVPPDRMKMYFARKTPNYIKTVNFIEDVERNKVFVNFVDKFYGLYTESLKSNSGTRTPFYMNRIFCALKAFVETKTPAEDEAFLRKIVGIVSKNHDLIIDILKTKKIFMNETGSKFVREENNAFKRLETFCIKMQSSGKTSMYMTDFLEESGFYNVFGKKISLKHRNERLDEMVFDGLIAGYGASEEHTGGRKKLIVYFVRQ